LSQRFYPFLFRFLGRLPLGALHAMGACLGWVVYLASAAYRGNLRNNLDLALPDATAAQRRAAIAHAGRQMLEMPFMWLRPAPEVLALVRSVSGWDAVEAARGRGAGLMFLTPHLGCFEITGRYIASRLPITVLFRAPKQAWLRPFMEAGRGRGNMRSVPADLGGVRALMRSLKHHEAIGLLPDQVPGGKGEGLWASFFGRPAYTMTLAARLSEIPGCEVIFVHAERLARAQGFHVHFVPPPLAIEGNLAQRVAAINRCVETIIRRCPEQYLWSYKRYKRPAGADEPPARIQA
jgi:KDO2-lipid IV(A) lauroyltransferase